MERIDDINPARIKWCLGDAHISLEQLALDVGIAGESLQKVMVGEGGLTFNQLKKIGDYFGRTALFFLEDEPVDEAIVRSQEFRSLLNQKVEVSKTVKKVIRLAEWQREIFVDLVDELGTDRLIRFNPPDVSELETKQAAAKVRDWLKLRNPRSFTDYRAALEAKGILVFRTNGYAGKWQIPKENPVLGFSLYDKKNPLIVVKKQGVEARQNFTLAHELGHLLLHKSSMIDDEQDLNSHKGKEAEANRFAGYFLVPDEYLLSISDEERPSNVYELDGWLSRQRSEWGVSTEVILLRLLENERISRRIYNEYHAWMSNQVFQEKDGGSRGYRHREPRHILGDMYVKVIFDALEQKKITLTKASKYLDDIKLTDLRELERYCASN